MHKEHNAADLRPESCTRSAAFSASWECTDAADLTYYGLHSLQHRGQEGCGIVSVSKEGAMRRVRGEGLVTEVFNEAKLANLAGDMAIGHVRYSTAGGGGIGECTAFSVPS